jgi:hypothetical protein
VHLESFSRREEYRRARQELLGGCGEKTLGADQIHLLQMEAMRTDGAQAVAVPAIYCLVDQDGIHKLKTGVNTIGRMPDNDIAVADGSVSRRHCAIVVHATRGCEVYDTASKNGTYVNGSRINGLTTLKVGDQIRLCDRQFVFVEGPHGNFDATSDQTHVDN